MLVALPMFGDYYTADLVSASTQTNMIGNQIDEFMRQGSEKVTGAVLTLVLALLLLGLMFYYLRRPAGPAPRRRGMSWLRNPWGRPRLLAVVDGRLHRLVGAAGRDRDRVRVQQGPLADDLAGLLVPLVHRVDRAACSTIRRCRERSSTR